MASIANKSSSSLLVLSLIMISFVVLPSCIEACGTCAPTPKPPSPPPKPKPCPPPPSPPSQEPQQCPRDALKLGVCADLLGLVPVVIGKPPSGSKCCALLTGLTDLEAAACLCTAIKANVLGVKLDVPVALSVLLSACQKTLPTAFTCK